MTDRILILDFGSQVTQLIARRVRENGVYCEIWPYTVTPDRIEQFAPRGIILSGGPATVTRADTPRAPDMVFRLGVPVLGICYGMQTLCAQLGGRVTLSEHQEFGRAFIDVTGACRLFEGLWPPGAREQVWMSHGDKVDALPPGFRAVASSEGAPYAAIADDERRLYGVAVPSRGRPHAAGRPAAWQFRAPRLRLRRGLDDGGVSRSGDRAHPRPRRCRSRHLRPVRRRQLGRGRGLAARGDRRAADLYLCRYRPPQAGRGRGGRATVPGASQHPARASRRRRIVPRQAQRGHRPGSRSARRSAPPSSTSSTRRRAGSAAPNSSRKARSTPT